MAKRNRRAPKRFTFPKQKAAAKRKVAKKIKKKARVEKPKKRKENSRVSFCFLYFKIIKQKFD